MVLQVGKLLQDKSCLIGPINGSYLNTEYPISFH